MNGLSVNAARTPLDASLNDTSTEVRQSQEVPPIELGNLYEFCDSIRPEQIRDCKHRESVIRHLLSNGGAGLYELSRIFENCERHGMREYLHLLYRIYRSLILIQSPALNMSLFSDRFIMSVIGALEYDAQEDETEEEFIPRRRHRDFLENEVKFIDVANLSSNVELCARIKQTYLVEYIHDIILPNVALPLDDTNTISALSSFLAVSKMTIAGVIQQDRHAFDRIRVQLKRGRNTENVLSFIRSLCLTSHSMLLDHKTSLHNTLVHKRVHEAVLRHFQSLDRNRVEERRCALDILTSILQNAAPSVSRKFIVNNTKRRRSFCDNQCDESVSSGESSDQSPIYSESDHNAQEIDESRRGIDKDIIEVVGVIVDTIANSIKGPTVESDDYIMALIKEMIADEDEYFTYGAQICASLKVILDSCALEASVKCVDATMNSFMANHFPAICQPLMDNASIHGPLKDDMRHCLLQSTILNFISDLILHEPFMVLETNGLSVNEVDRLLIETGCVDQLLDVLTEHSGSNNMFESALLDAFNYIRTNDRRILLNHVVSSSIPRLTSEGSESLRLLQKAKELESTSSSSQECMVMKLFHRMNEKLATMEDQSSEPDSVMSEPHRPNITDGGFMASTVGMPRMIDEEDRYFEDQQDDEEAELAEISQEEELAEQLIEENGPSPPKRKVNDDEDDEVSGIFAGIKRRAVVNRRTNSKLFPINIRMPTTDMVNGGDLSGSSPRRTPLVSYDLSSSSDSDDNDSNAIAQTGE
ncbi:hypothetical protein ACOME3_003509 [Neoechinorhynchus agilis]